MPANFPVKRAESSFSAFRIFASTSPLDKSINCAISSYVSPSLLWSKKTFLLVGLIRSSAMAICPTDKRPLAEPVDLFGAIFFLPSYLAFPAFLPIVPCQRPCCHGKKIFRSTTVGGRCHSLFPHLDKSLLRKLLTQLPVSRLGIEVVANDIVLILKQFGKCGSI